MIGIATSLFTSIFIARIFIDWNINKKNNLTFVTNFSKNMFNNFHFDFLGKKKWTYLISSIIVVVSFSSLAINGLDEGVDFVGGRTFQVRFEKPIETETVKAELAKVLDGSAEVKVFGSDNQLK